MKNILLKLKELWLRAKVSTAFWQLVVFLVFLLTIWLYINHLKNQNRKMELKYLVANEEMVSYRDKDSLNVAKIRVFEVEKQRDFLKIESKDSMIQFLQAEVKKYKSQIKQPGSSVTTVTNTTNVSGTSPTTVIPPTVQGKSPIYESSKNTEWIDIAIRASVDSTSYKLSIRNKYSVVIGYEKGIPFAQVKNFNPYTETTDLRTYQVTVPKPKRIGIGIQGGYGIGASGVTPYIGIGVSYNVFFLRL